MSNLSLSTLPSKFHPHLLGNPNCTVDVSIQNQIEQEYGTVTQAGGKSNVYMSEHWVFKGPRTDGLLTTPDTHLYRVRKACKIQAFITQHGLEGEFVIPEKYLYWDKNMETFFVASKKLDLSDKVAKPASPEIGKALAESCAATAPNTQVCYANQPDRQQELTPNQARALAELAFRVGYTDQSYNNVFFTEDGKVAILDTEPQKRGLNKLKQISSWKALLFGEKRAFKLQQALAGTAKLKIYCSSPRAKQVVEKIERFHVLWSIAELVGKIAISIFALYLLPTGLLLLPLRGSLYLKILITALAIFFDWYLWSLSHQGNIVGIANLESQGAL